MAEERGIAASSLGSEYDRILCHLADQKCTLLHQSHAAYLETERTDAPQPNTRSRMS